MKVTKATKTRTGIYNKDVFWQRCHRHDAYRHQHGNHNHRHHRFCHLSITNCKTDMASDYQVGTRNPLNPETETNPGTPNPNPIKSLNSKPTTQTRGPCSGQRALPRRPPTGRQTRFWGWVSDLGFRILGLYGLSFRAVG